MEPLVMTMLCLVLSALLTPSASLQIQLQSSYETANELQRSLPAVLPRKLKLFEITVKGYGGQDFQSYNRHKEYVAGKSNDKEQLVVEHGSKGTWQEERVLEGADTSEFFTMDYSKVRRRRPVHNKSMPVGP